MISLKNKGLKSREGPKLCKSHKMRKPSRLQKRKGKTEHDEGRYVQKFQASSAKKAR